MAAYNGTDNFPASVRIPNDGEDRNATVFSRALQDLTDRTTYLQNMTPGAGASALKLFIPLRTACGLGGASGWSEALASSQVPWYLTGDSSTLVNSAGKLLLLPLQGIVPVRGRITGFGVRVVGANHANLPATMPQLSLNVLDQSSFVWPQSASVNGAVYDTSSTTLAYSTPHTIVSQLGSPVSIVEACDYYVSLRNEIGANAVAGLGVIRAWVEVAV